jgi:hypothetical protein
VGQLRLARQQAEELVRAAEQNSSSDHRNGADAASDADAATVSSSSSSSSTSSCRVHELEAALATSQGEGVVQDCHAGFPGHRRQTAGAGAGDSQLRRTGDERSGREG